MSTKHLTQNVQIMSYLINNKKQIQQRWQVAMNDDDIGGLVVAMVLANVCPLFIYTPILSRRL